MVRVGHARQVEQTSQKGQRWGSRVGGGGGADGARCAPDTGGSGRAIWVRYDRWDSYDRETTEPDEAGCAGGAGGSGGTGGTVMTEGQVGTIGVSWGKWGTAGAGESEGQAGGLPPRHRELRQAAAALRCWACCSSSLTWYPGTSTYIYTVLFIVSTRYSYLLSIQYPVSIYL
jgi:hypothetical protein